MFEQRPDKDEKRFTFIVQSDDRLASICVGYIFFYSDTSNILRVVVMFLRHSVFFLSFFFFIDKSHAQEGKVRSRRMRYERCARKRRAFLIFAARLFSFPAIPQKAPLV